MKAELILKSAILLIVLTLIGCARRQDGSHGAASNQRSPAERQSERGTNAANEKEVSSRRTMDAPKLPVERELNLQANHANGVVLRLTKVSFSDDHITLNISVTNGHKEEIDLNDTGNDMFLRDNLGNRYNVAPPPQNPEIKVPVGSTLTGKFNFLGHINPSATSLTLMTNDKYGSNQDYSRHPKMAISDIPVQR